MRTGFHQVGDGPPIAGTLDHEIADERHGLGMVELDAAFEPPAGDRRRHGDHKLVLLTGGEVHVPSSAGPKSWQGAWVSQRHERRDQTTPECATAGRDESGDENVADHTRTCVRLSILLEADTQRISLGGQVSPDMDQAGHRGMAAQGGRASRDRSEEHTSELQSLMRSSYAVFCLKKKRKHKYTTKNKYNDNSIPHNT